MRAHRIVMLSVALGACAGPEASDAAVCADYIHRVCLQTCNAVERDLEFSGSCEPALLALTGCDSETFSFTTPSRDRFLECRVPLLRQGTNIHQAPSCEDVDESFINCPDVVAFLNGGAP